MDATSKERLKRKGKGKIEKRKDGKKRETCGSHLSRLTETILTALTVQIQTKGDGHRGRKAARATAISNVVVDCNVGETTES